MPPAELSARLTGLSPRDAHRLGRRLAESRRTREPAARQRALQAIAAEVDRASLRLERRRASVPTLDYPDILPVTQRKDEILAAIRDHQVVVVAGETGSGKTTQLPKICLELGRGVRAMIGHTQPRRIAARTVADRIAEELRTPAPQMGGVVGYQTRFTDQVHENTLVKLMTDGILLAEISSDRQLRRYDTLIIDEAHERSLNIDFILGYLRSLLPRRPDLKIVITSATIETARFSAHFAGAPVIEVSGRTYPVEVRYRPLVPAASGPAGGPAGGPASGPADARRTGRENGEAERDQTQAISEAVDELCAEGPGDILVFLSGEREIRDTAEALTREQRPNTEIVPLYARLSAGEQHRVFQPHTGRRVVLATNVAETSLTVPGIHYVIDPGTARISRYSHRTKVQRLPIEPISQASANQRKGRCGRTADGICIRLYSEEDFAGRPEFTDPEILRTNLASVILRMADLGLGEMATFGFLDPPDPRQISDGELLLAELGAFDATASDPRHRITPLGRRLAQIPVDPRLARMVLAADEQGCLREVLVIAAALAIQDPRERPVEHQQAADARHARFADPTSDFLAYLNLWNYLRDARGELSANQFRRMCRTEFLNYLRIREWQDVHGQLAAVVRGLGLTPRDDSSGAADPRTVHRALLTGLLSHIGRYDPERREYAGARGGRFALWPGSVLARRSNRAERTGPTATSANPGDPAGEDAPKRPSGPPAWVMAAELVETSRLWGRTAARIDPDWIEPLAAHLVHRTYSEPRWSRRQGAVLADEKVTLYGVTIVASRPVQYSRIDPVLCRELFLRHALVEGDWQTRHTFFHANRELLADVEELEHRARRRDIVVDDETLFHFYDERVPADIVSARHFDAWWRKARRTTPDLLDFPRSMLVTADATGITEADYPDVWQAGDLALPLSYQFEPGSAADGVTVHIPLAVLNQVGAEGFEWQVPGLREELVTALIRALPKAVRRSFVPAPNYAKAVLANITPRQAPLLTAVEHELRRMGGPEIPRDSWSLAGVPDHLRFTFRVEDAGGRVLAEGKDLDAIKERLRPRTREAVAAAADGLERAGLRAWGDLGTLPKVVELRRGGNVAGGHVVKAFPALVDEGGSVAVRAADTEAEQRQLMWAGTRRLVLLGVPSPVRGLNARLSNAAKLALSHNPHRDAADLLDDCVRAAADRLIAAAGGPAWDEAGFTALLAAVRAGLPEAAFEVVREVQQVLGLAHAVDLALRELRAPAVAASVADARDQLISLIYRGFVTDTGADRLADLVRYLTALERRLERLPRDPGRDRLNTATVGRVQDAYRELLATVPAGREPAPEIRRLRWMIEELRVSLFAQSLRTPYPVSEERVYRAIDAILG
ncbi:HrpA-like helicase [Frankia sp. CcI6]|nr:MULTISPECIES: ATP-dependent RNA helicase HrpA [unclassified Frankia]ETA03253.1 HrpA-like helicase [Frankia sp. CcI6]KDA43579.1 HrpA-like helicase [Frankia sp. BMG5.23]OFB44179.1 ATP-dependent helicase [Frankia sp. CgIM4]